MKVQEFIDEMNNSKNKMLKDDQRRTVIEKTLKVKKYLPIAEKRKLINEIIHNCILYKDGIWSFEEINKYVYFTMLTIAAYTDLELSDNIEHDYDMLCESLMLNNIVATFSREYDNISTMLQMQCQSLLYENSLEVKFNNFLNLVNNKLTDFVDNIEDNFNKIDLSKLKITDENLQKIHDFLNNN